MPEGKPPRHTCPVCGSARTRADPRLGAAYHDCLTCRFLWRVDRKSFPDPNRAYEGGEEPARDLVDQERNEARKAYYASHLARLHRQVDFRGRLLEIGCGTGGFSEAAIREGWEVLAVEPGSALADQAALRLGEERVSRTRVEYLDPGTTPFDAVVALDVLEHIPEADLLPKRVAAWLRPGGLFYLQTPNALSLRRVLQGPRWPMIQPDRHFLFHSRRSLRHLLGNSGFEVVVAETVSGTATAHGFRRWMARSCGTVLSALGIGNGLVVAARKT